jgi:hypothetical protein
MPVDEIKGSKMPVDKVTVDKIPVEGDVCR